MAIGRLQVSINNLPGLYWNQGRYNEEDSTPESGRGTPCILAFRSRAATAPSITSDRGTGTQTRRDS